MNEYEVQQSKFKYSWRPKLWLAVKPYLTSLSHNEPHLGSTNALAQGLARIYGGDCEVISAAVLVHDLGRSNKTLSGDESTLESIRIAQPLLSKSGFPQEKIEHVLQVVREHDDFEGPEPSSLEAKILFDADKLDGIGVRGVKRIRSWWKETGRSEESAEDAIKHKMPQRIDFLHFPESKELAERLMKQLLK